MNLFGKKYMKAESLRCDRSQTVRRSTLLGPPRCDNFLLKLDIYIYAYVCMYVYAWFTKEAKYA